MTGVQTIFGGASIGEGRAYRDVPSLEAAYDVLEAHGVKTIDTAQIYGESEELLGKSKAGTRFTLDSKVGGGFRPGTASKDGLAAAAATTLKLTGVDKLGVYYIHAPDHSIPFAETLAAIDKVHKAGHFSRFGLSNFKVEDVEKIHALCAAEGYVLPTVYQGNYSPVARLQDTLLFPTLRRLGIAFYAYSPLAGGFLTKTKQQILDGAGRFNEQAVGGLYARLYIRPAYLEALALWEAIAEEAGASKAELAYRWVKYNSSLGEGDGIIVGSSSLEQLRQTLEWLETGPLSDEVVGKIDGVWKTIEHEAPLDNFNH